MQLLVRFTRANNTLNADPNDACELQGHTELTLLGSMVQKGKFSAGMDTLPRTLNRVLFPTFGNPTIPICMPANAAWIIHSEAGIQY